MRWKPIQTAPAMSLLLMAGKRKDGTWRVDTGLFNLIAHTKDQGGWWTWGGRDVSPEEDPQPMYYIDLPEPPTNLKS